MSQWAFVIAAYGCALLGVGGLLGWAALTMRRAEAQAQALAQTLRAPR